MKADVERLVRRRARYRCEYCRLPQSASPGPHQIDHMDEHWFVPHFEKMLYDQAQLAVSYLEAFQITGDALYADVARSVFDYVLRDLAHPEGGFYSAEDADSAADPAHPHEKGEGAFYIWTHAEIVAALGAEAAAIFARRYGVEERGNVHEDPHGEFGGRNILYQAREVEESHSH